jgi:hypothetical protein
LVQNWNAQHEPPLLYIKERKKEEKKRISGLWKMGAK